jgi:hypothetical protein
MQAAAGCLWQRFCRCLRGGGEPRRHFESLTFSPIGQPYMFPQPWPPLRRSIPIDLAVKCKLSATEKRSRGFEGGTRLKQQTAIAEGEKRPSASE